ncbi:MAG: succinate dehydrogenase [Rhodopirellula sp.]|nr:succinate dehydrogenase [Rhodopirellula sp.]OUX52111.1 MAG: succinate dehydrogenase [Rhodopirellula sp. TMED283]
MSAQATAETNFFLRHEFLIRRIHSLLGIVPLGLYMTVHLATNASLLNGTETFQRAVFLIHSPGKLLPLIEWGLIFTPLIFHAVIGIWIAKSGKSNSSQYQFRSNKRYTWQRWTGFIALVYLFFHILHLHGWFHISAWEAIIRPLGFGVFRPFNAASSLVRAMQEWGYVWPAFYLVGMLACVYHLANGLWTSGITWGLWISPTAQARASKLCTVIGCGLAVLGISAWWAAVSPSSQTTVEMEVIENRMYEAAVVSGMVTSNVEKRSEPVDETAEVAASERLGIE